MKFCVQYSDGPAAASVDGDALRLTVPVSLLGGAMAEQWGAGCGTAAAAELDATAKAAGCTTLPGNGQWLRSGDWLVAEEGDLLWACALADASDLMLEDNSRELYGELLGLSVQKGYQLQRIWQYIPRINEPDANGLERYRAFCRGRSLAFELALGEEFHNHLPAASAVGCCGSQLVMYACARKAASVRYFENPLQMPAYRYPEAYGPRAPGFARASVAEFAVAGRPLREVFISGTASIRKERSLTQGGIEGQLQTTAENLNGIACETGLEPLFPSLDKSAASVGSASIAAAVGGGAGMSRSISSPAAPHQFRRFKVYLRRASDYENVATRFGALLQEQDAVSYVLSDICRAELDVEIEASVFLGPVLAQ